MIETYQSRRTGRLVLSNLKKTRGLLQLPETRGGWVITRRETHGLLAGDTELHDVRPKLLLFHVIDTSALATFNQQGLLVVPSDAQGKNGGCAIMRDFMCDDGSNHSRSRM